jgi:DNA replication protein DnaC
MQRAIRAPCDSPAAPGASSVGFASLDDTGTQLLFRFVAAAYERRSLAIASRWPFEDWGRLLPEHTTAVSILDRLLHHATVVVTSGDSYRMRESRQPREGHPISI